MSSFRLIAIIVLSSFPILARSQVLSKEDRPWSVSASVSGVAQPVIIKSTLPDLDPFKHDIAFLVGIRYSPIKLVSLGMTAAYQSVFDKEMKPFCDHLNASINVYFNWYTNGTIWVYSGVGYGVEADKWRFGFDWIPLGLEIGGRWFGMIEWGFGKQYSAFHPKEMRNLFLFLPGRIGLGYRF